MWHQYGVTQWREEIIFNMKMKYGAVRRRSAQWRHRIKSMAYRNGWRGAIMAAYRKQSTMKTISISA